MILYLFSIHDQYQIQNKSLAFSLPISGVMKRGGIDGSETLVVCCYKPEQGHYQVCSKSTAGLAGDVGVSLFRPIGDKSGETAGQSSVLTFCYRRKSVTTRAS